MENNTSASQGDNNVSSVTKHLIFDKIAYILLTAAIFVLPLFFISYAGFSLQVAKTAFVFGLTIVAFILWLVGRLREGRLVLPAPAFIVVGCGLILVTFVSALFSGAAEVSTLGLSFEIGTAVSLALLFILSFLVLYYFRSKTRIFYTYLAILASFGLVALYTILRLIFGSSFLSFGYFTDIVSNLVGKWNDLGIFFSVIVLLSTLSLELVQLSGVWRKVLYLSLAVSLGLMIVVNFGTLWVVLAIFSLLFGVYLIVTKYRKVSQPVSLSEAGQPSVSDVPTNKRLPIVTLVVFVVSVIFILFGSRIGNVISTRLQIFQIESRPSWQTTFAIAKETLKTDPMLGAGPNRFVTEWQKYKPSDVNTSVFWGIDFAFGIGLLPTLAVTTGLLGLLFWLLFFMFYLKVGVKSLITPITDQFNRYLVLSSFIVSLFLWVFFVIYVPTAVVIVLTFVFTGLFLATAANVSLIKTKDISFAGNPKAGLTSVIGLIILLVLGLLTLYGVATRFASALTFQKSIFNFSVDGDVEKARQTLLKAVDFSDNDLLYRSLSEIGLLKINQLLAGQSNLSADVLRDKFLSEFGETLNFAKRSVDFDGTNYQNYVSLGRVYESVVPLRIQGAYENASGSYLEAVKRNPHGPALYLTLARLEVANGNTKKAREYIAKAREEKSNYTEAVFFLSQLEAADGNIREAIVQADAAALLAPNDPVVHFQLGLLKYNNRDYRGAVSALERAVVLNTVYANARYFLGLSLSNLGRTKEAIDQFEEVVKTNPDSAEVKLILANLKAGRPPFADAKPPLDDKPEKRSELPLPDDNR